MSCSSCNINFDIKEDFEAHVIECTNFKEESKNNEQYSEKTKTINEPPTIKKEKSPGKITIKEDDPTKMGENHKITKKDKTHPFKCSRCKKNYVTEKEWNLHMEKEHNKLPTEDKDVLRLTSELTALLEAVPKEDANETMKKEDRPKRNRRKVNDIERIYECDICRFQTTNFDDHNVHRRSKHKLGRSTLPPNGAPIQIKRKLVTLTTGKYQCEKCDFSTKNKAYLPQHMKKIHGKVPRNAVTTNNELTRTTSVDSTSTVFSPPNKTRKVTNKIVQNAAKDDATLKKHSTDNSQQISEEELDLCYQKLLRGKSAKEVATNTDKEIENNENVRTDVSTLVNKIKELDNIITGAREVIENLEVENEDLHKKVNYLGNNADLVDDLLRQISKIKKESNEHDQSCLLCDETNITRHELRYHVRKIHQVEEDLENEEDENLREWLQQLEDNTECDQDEEVNKQLLGRDHEIKKLNEIIHNKEKCLKKYENENEELSSKVELLKRVVKVTESKLNEKEVENEQMDQDEDNSEALRLFHLKNSGHSKTSPQSNFEMKRSSLPFSTINGGSMKTFMCHICKQGGINEMAIEAHMKCHRKESDFKCDDCSFQTNNIDVLKNHSKIVKHNYTTKVRDFICEKCGIECETMSELREHKKRHDAKNKMKCNICDQEFNSKSQLRNHMREAHEILREDWNKIQSENSTVEDGMDQSQEIPNIQCNFCESKFTNKNNMWQHRKEKHQSHKPCRNFPNCEYAGRCVYSHITIPDGKVRCFECGNDFGTQKALMIHRKTVHQDSTPCRNFLENKCERSSEECWYSHINPKHNLPNNTTATNQQRDFQFQTQNQAPPGNQPQDTLRHTINQPQILNQLQSIIPGIMNQMMPQIIMKIMEKIQ